MIEADILLRGCDPIEPIMAHPPQNDSDITLREWLKEVMPSGKGIKLDFKRLSQYLHTGFVMNISSSKSLRIPLLRF